jgi:hypothetical protein
MRGDSIIVFVSPLEGHVELYQHGRRARIRAWSKRAELLDAVLLRSSRDTRRITVDTVQSDVSLKRYFAPEGKSK